MSWMVALISVMIGDFRACYGVDGRGLVGGESGC